MGNWEGGGGKKLPYASSLSYAALKHIVVPLSEAGQQPERPQRHSRSYLGLSSCAVVITGYVAGRGEAVAVCQQPPVPQCQHLPPAVLAPSLACS